MVPKRNTIKIIENYRTMDRYSYQMGPLIQRILRLERREAALFIQKLDLIYTPKLIFNK